MKITEDADDRNRLFDRLGNDRWAVRAKQYGPPIQQGWPRKHMLMPCVRRGAGSVFLTEQEGWTPPKSMNRGMTLNFLRGHSHEALVTEGQSITIVYEGVANELDEWTGAPEAPFTEVKSTMLSSARMWTILKKGEVDILHPFETDYFASYFSQCCQNCVAAGIDHCRLRILFLNGEYGLRRKKCPECSGDLSEQRDVYKECLDCGYKSYSVDLRSYILAFTPKELSYYRREVFGKRRDQYRLAVQSESVAELLMRAEPTKSYLCKNCSVGQKIECEFAGASE